MTSTPYSKEKYEANKESFKLAMRKYYEKNKEKYRQYGDKYRINHKDKIRDNNRKWRMLHPKYTTEYYKKNRDKIIENIRRKRRALLEKPSPREGPKEELPQVQTERVVESRPQES